MEKKTFIDNETVIDAAFLNALQDDVASKLDSTKQASKTPTMTQPVGVDTNGALWVPGDKQYRITVNSDASGHLTADKTFSEIDAASNAGYELYCAFYPEGSTYPMRLPLVSEEHGYCFSAVTATPEGASTTLTAVTIVSDSDIRLQDIPLQPYILGGPVTYAAQTVSEEKKAQARSNINAKNATSLRLQFLIRNGAIAVFRVGVGDITGAAAALILDAYNSNQDIRFEFVHNSALGEGSLSLKGAPNENLVRVYGSTSKGWIEITWKNDAWSYVFTPATSTEEWSVVADLNLPDTVDRYHIQLRYDLKKLRFTLMTNIGNPSQIFVYPNVSDLPNDFKEAALFYAPEADYSTGVFMCGEVDMTKRTPLDANMVMVPAETCVRLQEANAPGTDPVMKRWVYVASEAVPAIESLFLYSDQDKLPEGSRIIVEGVML